MFPTLAEEKVDEVKPLMESYNKYKREYVKYLSFSPGEENLSEQHFNLSSWFVSSFGAGACTTWGSVHLLRHSNLWWDWEGREGELFYLTQAQVNLGSDVWVMLSRTHRPFWNLTDVTLADTT